MAGQIADYRAVFISGKLNRDIEYFKNLFKKDAFLRIKEIKSRNGTPIDCALLFMDGMSNSERITESITKPLITVKTDTEIKDLADYIDKRILFANDVKKVKNVADILTGILYGEALLLIDKSETALLLDVKGFPTRGFTEPQEERILAGPREGFEEQSLKNLSALRRKLLTPDLCIEPMRVGRRTSTAVYVCYLESLCDKKLVKAVKEKIQSINIDGILDTNYIVEQISENRFSLFKTNGSTERPDIVAARLLEGRVAIMVDGTPIVATVPYLFSENFQSDEDYYQNFLLSSAERILRWFCFFLSISTPGLFIALSTFHREFLPTEFAMSVMHLRGGVPFTPVTECLVMILVFEILREAGIRMSQNLGHALSIVGGLVVGQAAVDARIISSPILIIVALSGIAGLMLPRLKTAILYLRIVFVLISAALGLYGYLCGGILLLLYILSLNSYSSDYTVSLNKANFQSLKDTFLRASWRNMKERPHFNKNIVRKGTRK